MAKKKEGDTVVDVKNYDCTICKDKKYNQEGSIRVECKCALEVRAINYLTPMYKKSKFLESLSNFILKFEGKNLLFNGTQNRMKDVLRTFLYKSLMKYSHDSVTANEIFGYHFLSNKTNDYEDLKKVNLLIILLMGDPPNKNYGLLISSLIRARTGRGLGTWVYAPTLLNSKDGSSFTSLYSVELNEFLIEGGGGDFILMPEPGE